jgi:hypothetical protein
MQNGPCLEIGGAFDALGFPLTESQAKVTPPTGSGFRPSPGGGSMGNKCQNCAFHYSPALLLSLLTSQK